jgi:transcriptional regulator with XRE-family HTH domain
MPHVPSSEVHGLVVRARTALELTQKELAEMFDVSLRTASRWEGGISYPDAGQLGRLARAVHPKDAALAEGLAGEAGTTLEALGVVERRKSAPPAAVPLPPPPRTFPPIDLMVDSVILAAVDAAARHTESPLRERPALLDVLRAAISRARRLGLTLEEVDSALSPGSAARPEVAPAPKQTAKKNAAAR